MTFNLFLFLIYHLLNIDHMNENVEDIFNYLRVYNPENVHRLSL